MENKRVKRSVLSWAVGALTALSCLLLLLPGGRDPDGFRGSLILINLANVLNVLRSREERK